VLSNGVGKNSWLTILWYVGILANSFDINFLFLLKIQIIYMDGLYITHLQNCSAFINSLASVYIDHIVAILNLNPSNLCVNCTTVKVWFLPNLCL